MMSQLSMWLVVAALGQQTPAATPWLDSVPAEADVVIRVRGLEGVQKDLDAMLKAMSPTLAGAAGPALAQQLSAFRASYGQDAASRPFLTLMRVVTPENPGAPPFAIVVQSSDYDAVLKSAGGGQAPKLQREAGGYDSFARPDGSNWYAAKGAGLVAFGADKTLVAGFAKPGSKALGKTIAPALLRRFNAGDVGVYVNAAALATRYADQIAGAKQMMMQTLDQAGAQMGPGVDMAKKIWGGMFDSLQVADALALSLDFAAEGLGIDSNLMVKAGSDAAKSIAAAQPGDAASLAKLPGDFAYYVYMSLDAKAFDKLQAMGLSMMSPNAKPTPEMTAALAKLDGLGRVESTGATSIGGGMKTFNVAVTSDPKKLFDTTLAALKAIKGSDSPLMVFKDVVITPEAEKYAGFTFARSEMTLDPDKIAKSQPGNPNAVKSMMDMFGGSDKVTSWIGVDAKRLVQVNAPSWDQAKAQIDAYLKGTGGLGDAAGFRAARARLPERASFLGLFSAQGFVRQMVAMMAMNPAAAAAPPATDMPKEPAFIAASLTPMPPTGYEFHLYVPSPVGAVIEKGLLPVIQGMRGGAPAAAPGANQIRPNP